jgi:hypothetical protein
MSERLIELIIEMHGGVKSLARRYIEELQQLSGDERKQRLDALAKFLKEQE